MPDSPDYAAKKAFYNRVLTVFGRKPVLETLLDTSLDIHAVHLADSNKPAAILTNITEHATGRDIPVHYHNRSALARISKNGKQDQGVAVDIVCPAFTDMNGFLETRDSSTRQRLLALDGITNPQNLGMIIRSAAAGAIDGIIVPRQGTAALGPLVIKASAGTVYRAPIISCETLPPALSACIERGAQVCVLDAGAPTSLFEHHDSDFSIYVLGNETEGISKAAGELADTRLAIPMRNGVESLNVAVTASLIAFGGLLGNSYLER